MAQVKKLSVATVYGKISLRKLLDAPDQTLDLMHVIGSAVGTKSDSGVYGTWTSLQGVFKAINLETGEDQRSSTCFLPDVALTPILVQLGQEGVRSVDFAIKLSVRYSEAKKPGGVPYEYVWEPLLEADSSTDPIARMEARLLAKASETKRLGNKSEPEDEPVKGKPARKSVK